LSIVPYRVLVSVIVPAILLATSALAQPIISAKAGIVTKVEGKVLLDNKSVEPSVTRFHEMHEDSVLRTEAGRAEVLLQAGYVLRLGENSSLRMLNNRLTQVRVRLEVGSAVVELSQELSDAHANIVVGDGEAILSKFGVYRFDAKPARLAVLEAIVPLHEFPSRRFDLPSVHSTRSFGGGKRGAVCLAVVRTGCVHRTGGSDSEASVRLWRGTLCVPESADGDG
jgi:hypothetical protein